MPFFRVCVTQESYLSIVSTGWIEEQWGLSSGPPTLESRPPRRGREPSCTVGLMTLGHVHSSSFRSLIAHCTPACFTSPRYFYQLIGQTMTHPLCSHIYGGRLISQHHGLPGLPAASCRTKNGYAVLQYAGIVPRSCRDDLKYSAAVSLKRLNPSHRANDRLLLVVPRSCRDHAAIVIQ